MNQWNDEINTRIFVQAQNDAVIVERLKTRIDELTFIKNTKYDESDHYHILKALQEILGEENEN